jgi:hypothetical protein
MSFSWSTRTAWRMPGSIWPGTGGFDGGWSISGDAANTDRAVYGMRPRVFGLVSTSPVLCSVALRRVLGLPSVVFIAQDLLCLTYLRLYKFRSEFRGFSHVAALWSTVCQKPEEVRYPPLPSPFRWRSPSGRLFRFDLDALADHRDDFDHETPSLPTQLRSGSRSSCDSAGSRRSPPLKGGANWRTDLFVAVPNTLAN